MRIAVIGTRGSAGPARDAIDQALSALCPRLARRGHRIDVFSERNGHAFGPIGGAQVIRLPSLRWGESSSHPTLSALLSTCRAYDVVNFVAAEPSGLFSRAARFGPYRTVVSIHGAAATPLPRPAREDAAARFADVVTVSSRRLERLFHDRYGRDAIYLPNGVEPPRGAPDPGQLAGLGLGLQPDGYMLLADRLTPDSAAHLAVAAAGDAAMPLVVAETGPGDDAYRDGLIRQAAPGRVIFVGAVAPAAVDVLIAHSYLYLLPSQADDAPPGLMTALAHGRGVVVSDLPDHLDLVGADGFTFTAGDVGDLRRVVHWLLADRAVVAQVGGRAAGNVTARYCWDRIAGAYEQIYQALTEGA